MTHLLLGRIGIIKPNNQFSFIHLGKILVEQCSLGMSNMQITTGLRGEPCDYFSFLRIRQTKREARGRFVRPRFGGFGLSETGQRDLRRIKTFEMGEPAEEVGVLIIFE